jgi:hypothetical protein
MRAQFSRCTNIRDRDSVDRIASGELSILDIAQNFLPPHCITGAVHSCRLALHSIDVRFVYKGMGVVWEPPP